MRKWFYTGAIFEVGPYRGETPELVADRMDATIREAAKRVKIKVDEARPVHIGSDHPACFAWDATSSRSSSPSTFVGL